MPRNRKLIAAIALCGMFYAASPVVRGAYAITAADEAAVKVGYIYNFMKFVEWPEGSVAQDYIVCVLGSNPFGNVVNSLGGKTIRGRGVRVVNDVQLEQTKYCHVVFVSRSESGRLMPSLLRMRRLPLLTISDIEGFAAKGGVIELSTSRAGEISFRVSQQNAEDVGLRVSSKLLSMSR